MAKDGLTAGAARRRAERESGYNGPLDRDGNRLPANHPNAAIHADLRKLPKRAK